MNRFIQGIFELQTPFNMVVLIILIVMGTSVIAGIATQIR